MTFPQPGFFYRPTWNEHRFLAGLPVSGPFDAALLLGRHLAPHPVGSRSHNWGWTGRELPDAVLDGGADFLVDPDTPVLTAGTARQMPTPRVALMPHAQVLTLPISRIVLANNNDRVDFVRAALAQQAGAAMLTAPYFRFERRGRGWYGDNLQLIADTMTLAGGRPVVCFVHASVEALRQGDVVASARDFATTGASLGFLRIAGFDPQTADGSVIAAYRTAIDAFESAGLAIAADAVGRFGLVLAGAGSAGFSSGARHHRFVPSSPIYDADEMTSDPMTYEVPDRWFGMTATQARQAAAAGLIPGCPVGRCGALTTGSRPRDLTEHFVHYCVSSVRRYAAAGVAGTRQSLTGKQSRSPQTWLRAL
jgi:hypothetical protein